MLFKKQRNIFGIFFTAFYLLLLFSCGAKKIPNRSDQARIDGVVSYQGKPAARAVVYAYLAVNAESGEDRRQIERFLRSQGGAVKEPAEAIPEEAEEIDDYPEYRGPADYKSAPTGEDGRYTLFLSAGRYVLAARKHADPKISVGPLTPQDYSSLLSEPMTVEAGKIYRQDFLLERLAEQIIDFNTRYAIKIRQTEIRGIITDEKLQPLAGFYVTAKRNLKVSNRPDFFSDPSDDAGRYTLYLPGEGVYYLELRRSPLGDILPVRLNSRFVNAVDNSVEILEGEVIGGVQIIYRPGADAEKEMNNGQK